MKKGEVPKRGGPKEQENQQQDEGLGNEIEELSKKVENTGLGGGNNNNFGVTNDQQSTSYHSGGNNPYGGQQFNQGGNNQFGNNQFNNNPYGGNMNNTPNNNGFSNPFGNSNTKILIKDIIITIINQILNNNQIPKDKITNIKINLEGIII